MFTQLCRIQYFEISCTTGQINTVQPFVHHCCDAPTVHHCCAPTVHHCCNAPCIMHLIPINLVGYDHIQHDATAPATKS